MLTSLVSLQQRNVKKSEKLIKIINRDKENLHIFWTIWKTSMKFSGKMWLMITCGLCFWKNHKGFTVNLPDKMTKGQISLSRSINQIINKGYARETDKNAKIFIKVMTLKTSFNFKPNKILFINFPQKKCIQFLSAK